MKRILKLEPYFKDVLWGGTALSDVFGMNIPTDTTGEAFSASTVPGFCSTAGGEDFSRYAGDSSYTGEGGFNILFKLIDAKEPLSVQVHPDDELAKKLEGGRGKTECWYVLAAKEGAFLYLGFKDGVKKEDFVKAIESGTADSLLNRVPVKPGDFFFVPAKTVHAIGKGILIAELQQSCDTTYRVYDYNRRDKEGNLRPLHIEKAMLSSSFEPYKNVTVRRITESRERLCSCEYFTFDRVTLSGTECEESNEKYMLIFFESGSGKITLGDETVSAKKGETFFIAAHSGAFTVSGEGTYLKMTE